MPDVSISIVNYNSKGLLDDCIASLIKSMKGHSYEIIVVDNASTDRSAEMVKTKYPQIRLIINKSNYGFIKANNIGIRTGGGKYLLSLNNDTIIKGGSIDRLIDFMENNPDAGAVGPKLLNSNGSIQKQCRRSFPNPLNALYYFTGLSDLFPKSRRFGQYLLSYIDDLRTQEVDSLCGAAMMVRREAIEKVGLMDENYFMYGDDIDWCYRIKEAGYKVCYVPDAEIIHFGGMGGSRKRSYRNIIEFHRAMAIFYKKHYSKRYLFLVNWLVYAGIWLKCSYSLTLNLFRKDKYVGTKKP